VLWLIFLEVKPGCHRTILKWSVSHREAAKVERASGVGILISQLFGHAMIWQVSPSGYDRHSFVVEDYLAILIKIDIDNTNPKSLG
jgi:hypothetical protein